MKYASFQQITRARSVAIGIASEAEFSALAHAILASLLPVPEGVRLLGLSLSSLENSNQSAHPQVVAEPSPTQHQFGF
ncbi:MAG TPA: DNA polymerase IV, partial [Kineobactrum sp.]